ncbi:MAG: hypothetical protein ACTHKG_15105 [Nocardioides sp.]
MPDWNLVNRAHVLAVLDEYDRLGSREFLSRYRFGRSTAYTLWHGGQEYDSKAVLGVAYLHATGRAATRDELADSLGGGAKVLERLGFDIAVDEEEVEREERARAARAPASSGARSSAGTTTVAGTARKAPARKAAEKKPARIKPAEREVKLCPTCYTELPATGVCDFCD